MWPDNHFNIAPEQFHLLGTCQIGNDFELIAFTKVEVTLTTDVFTVLNIRLVRFKGF